MLIVAAAGLFGWVIAREQGPQAVTEAMLQFTDNPIVFLLLINVILLITGMILEPVAGLLITVPVLLPAAIEFGIDPLHLGIVMILNLVLGLSDAPGWTRALRAQQRHRKLCSNCHSRQWSRF